MHKNKIKFTKSNNRSNQNPSNIPGAQENNVLSLRSPQVLEFGSLQVFLFLNQPFKKNHVH